MLDWTPERLKEIRGYALAVRHGQTITLCDALEAAWVERDKFKRGVEGMAITLGGYQSEVGKKDAEIGTLKKEVDGLRLRLRLDTEAMNQATEVIKDMRSTLAGAEAVKGK